MKRISEGGGERVFHCAAQVTDPDSWCFEGDVPRALVRTPVGTHCCFYEGRTLWPRSSWARTSRLITHPTTIKPACLDSADFFLCFFYTSDPPTNVRAFYTLRVHLKSQLIT